jgi:hypothetical protein
MSSGRITQIEIQPLSRWARLALAARCLRRARSLVHPDPAHASVLDTALSRLEETAGTGVVPAALEESAAAAYTLALDNLDAPSPADADADVITCMVAHAAAFACEAATLSDARQASHLVAQSVDFAVHAFRLAPSGDAPAAVAGMRDDLQRLWSAAAVLKDEPVPASFFG